MPDVSDPAAVAELQAPDEWRQIEFISDLHLSSSSPRTVAAFLAHLARSEADAIFLLGDVFEVWIGDDVLTDRSASCPAPDARHATGSLPRHADNQDPTPGTETDLLDALCRQSGRCWIGYMHGNRDFLLGEQALRHCGWHALPDPMVLRAFDRRLLLSHGDALCLGDHDYQRFRVQSRDPAWRARFLAQPLAERRKIARQLRQASETRKSEVGFAGYADVDGDEALRWLQAARADTLVHGHTHRPARHALDATRSRWVLSDWDLDQPPARADLLRLSADGLLRCTLDPVTDAWIDAGPAERQP